MVLRLPLIPVACALDTVLEESVDQTLGHGRLFCNILRILLWVLWRRLLIVERGSPGHVAASIASIAMPASVVCSARALLARRALTTVWASRAATTSQMLVGELLGKAVGIVACLAWGLEVPLLPLVLGLLVGVHEVAPAIAITLLLLLRTPDLLLAGLVGVHGLWEGRGSGGECSTIVLELVVAVTASQAKVEVQPVRLLLVAHCRRWRGDGGLHRWPRSVVSRMRVGAGGGCCVWCAAMFWRGIAAGELLPKLAAGRGGGEGE